MEFGAAGCDVTRPHTFVKMLPARKFALVCRENEKSTRFKID
jgi:hypothetical protein